MIRVEFNPMAEKALKETAHYIKERSQSIEVALNYVNRLRKKVKNRLEVFPNSGQLVGTKGNKVYFKIIVEKYTFIYRVEKNGADEIVVVTNVIHEKLIKK